jgi:hypothetical protein
MDPDLDPTPDQTPSFIDFREAKKNIFFIFFLITCPQAHHLQSKKIIFLLKLLCSNVILQALFQFAQHFYEKGKDPDPDPYLLLMDPDPRVPKTFGSCGSGSPTLSTAMLATFLLGCMVGRGFASLS